MHGRFIRRGAEFAFKRYRREETVWIRQDNVVVFGSGFVTQDRAMSRAFSINGLVASMNGFESVLRYVPLPTLGDKPLPPASRIPEIVCDNRLAGPASHFNSS